MAEILRNNKAYDSADVTVFINGVSINVSKIAYGNEREHQLNHVLKRKAHSWSMGKDKPTASMTLPMDEIVPIETASGGSILDIPPFTITVGFVNEYNVIVVDKIIAKFQSEGRDVTGDMGLEQSFDLFALDVQLNVNSN